MEEDDDLEDMVPLIFSIILFLQVRCGCYCVRECTWVGSVRPYNLLYEFCIGI